MNLRVYMNDWSMNMGIVGFLNILNHVDLKDEVTMKDNYIEFDSSILENFNKHYFKYFLDKDNIYKSINNNVIMKLNYIKSNHDKLKSTVEQLKKDLMYQNGKVKNYFKDDAKIISENLNLLKGIKKEEDLEHLNEIVNNCLEIFEKRYINEKLTINKTRSYIGDNFFGQVSFLQKPRATLSIEEQAEFMYRDYILPILDYCNLNELLQKQDIDKLIEFIDKRLEDKNTSKAIEGIFKDIKKISKKNKDIDLILNYYNSDNLKICEMCSDHKGIVSNYTEGHFSPLAVSGDNAMNMYWDMKLDFSICDICKLMLFCTPAGSNMVRKNYIKEGENEFYTFINMDTSIDDLYNKNIIVRNAKDRDSVFKELILDMVGENKKKSEWQLGNILFIEFKAIDSKKCTLNYFDIPTYSSKFFCDESKTLDSIKDKSLKLSVIDLILKERDLKYLINEKIREKLTDSLNSSKGFYTSTNDIYKVIKIRYTLDCYKKGGKEKVDEKKLKSVRYAGREIHDYYVQNNSKNKIDGIAYRLLNTAKVRNKKDFMDIILRLFMSCEKSVPTVFLDVMAEKELDFESIAYAFISGLISEKYETNTMEGK
ncbi:type I-B CRISPR-associated protein Cas8b1/Cst1 [Romboutsia lituseburensis]|uniref:type I-B CRISPR-associated protein Cas8b1/Cst1 n=1 Tax=Romboutsia lituseburensis TaxID=1537 RepID=UPI00215AE970|nr:type I-B CRISPR-associated protein Cas8b1/Cst1 [Romboutsia lituseburensis]MCR8743766.1 type I-B CRISPR-associated protein Cas8b1/Cst1 [Romboutsia lituseburensis]